MSISPSGKVVLIGFMGTGKSSVSRLLAEKLAWSCADSDAEVERAEGRSISDIFAEDGEQAFRDMESHELSKLLKQHSHTVIATGGGAVLREDNRSAMLQHGFVVALSADPEQIIARVLLDKSRPLLEGAVRERVYGLLETRKGAYDFAHLTVDTTELSVEEVVDCIVMAWKQHSTFP
ncbi:shikimate kinase [Paenibacillus sp. 1011MAR3C5]|uniref:shikimate kinase n=1 Tax=Paenibacillus sp. 1011MAR3C5 TaxID=1675787 RepID=UPI002873C856|nr:shikimate kinase [Paenibacillus sp. 1011MAR3C5]